MSGASMVNASVSGQNGDKGAIILAMETSVGHCAVSLIKNNVITQTLQIEETGQQSSALIPMIEELLQQNALSYHDCDAFACTIGPGGFTGIRVGLTTAKALSLVSGIPVIGISSLETLAFASNLKGDIVVMIDAYRGQYYVQRFRKGDGLQSLSDPMLVEAGMIAAIAHGAKIVEAKPQVEDLAKLAYYKWSRGERHFPTSPLYIREPDAKLPQQKLEVSV